MCLTTRLLESRPLASALDSAFLRRPRRNWADLTGHRARVTPNCLPIFRMIYQHLQFVYLWKGPWPAGNLDGGGWEVPIFYTLRAASNATAKSAEGNRLLLLEDVVQEGNSTLQLPAVDGLGGFPSVLERNAKIGSAGAGRLGRLDLVGCVPNLSLGVSFYRSH